MTRYSKGKRRRHWAGNVVDQTRSPERRAPVDIVVSCACWCEQATVGVLSSELRKGLTNPCARPGCIRTNIERRKAQCQAD